MKWLTKQYPTPWVTKFAWRPTYVAETADNRAVYVWFEFYEFRRVSGNTHEHRLPVMQPGMTSVEFAPADY